MLRGSPQAGLARTAVASQNSLILQRMAEAMFLRLADAYIVPQFGLVQHLAESQTCSPHQSSEVRQVLDGPKSLKIPLQISLHIARKPTCACVITAHGMCRHGKATESSGISPVLLRPSMVFDYRGLACAHKSDDHAASRPLATLQPARYALFSGSAAPRGGCPLSGRVVRRSR